MLITIFAKAAQTKEGRKFYRYISTLTNKNTGEEKTVAVKFRESCGAPDASKCPMNIMFNKGDANLSKRNYTREDTGEIADSYTLWVSNWAMGPEYVDTSLDDYE